MQQVKNKQNFLTSFGKPIRYPCGFNSKFIYSNNFFTLRFNLHAANFSNSGNAKLRMMHIKIRVKLTGLISSVLDDITNNWNIMTSMEMILRASMMNLTISTHQC